MKVRRTWVPLGLFLVLLVLPGALGASAEAVVCGQVLTEDTVLDRNLDGCPGDGLIIAAPGVTLDINGHSISGADGNTGRGVWVAADQVTVEDGSISGFGTGIFEAGDGQRTGWTFRLMSVRVVDNALGVYAADPADETDDLVTIESSRIERNAKGVIVGFKKLTVTDSRIRRNGGDGILAFEAFPGRYERNDISDNAGIGLALSDSWGTMIDNHFNHNGGSGVFLETDHGDPLSFSFAMGNEASHNAGLGFSISSISPWEGFDGGGNIAKGNGDPRECVVGSVSWDPGPPIPPDALVCHRNKADI